MDERRDLLVEIGTEEMPPKSLARLSLVFASGVQAGLDQAGLAHGEVRPYATPRRLAVQVHALATAQAGRVEERRGPALSASFDEDGNPTQAALGFARACGVAVEALEKQQNEKGAWLAFRRHLPGRPSAELIPSIVSQALAELPIPKRMRWSDLKIEFVRPVHWVVLLFGDTVIDAEILGQRGGRHTRGHRFHHPQPLYLAEPAAYAPLLETEGHVLPDHAARREAVRAQAMEAAAALGGTALIDAALLDEVTALVEWPVAVRGAFEEHFLKVPPEVLITTMQDHQRYFPVVDGNGKLMPRFIAISNIESRDPAQVRTGNERVIRPRFSDAAFFWEQDRKQPLASRLDTLKSVVFQERLGSLYDKTLRVAALARRLAAPLGADAHTVERAARLSKCDLLTSLVGEFPELQGVMGRYYALHDAEPAELAWALEEHYRPRYAGDALPQTVTGRALAIADKLDTLVGGFAAGLKPTGDKDPFALRRAALGVLRICIECGLALDLEEQLNNAAAGYPAAVPARDAVGEVFDFMMERLRGYYLDSGFGPDAFEAVLACRPTRPLDFDRRLRAVAAFRARPEAESLTAANKRIRNILKQTQDTIPAAVNPGLLREPAESALAERLAALTASVAPWLDAGEYTRALSELARLRGPVDAFFDGVMVMTDDPALRANRLALLAALSGLFLRVADLSRLQG